ncbi:hypothetical protein Hypma_002869 [Hypsizygus marmoreus]|uniref:F-box domain-containing protein n=1 Tax=Hypsizygus marmoreus TaxID=39966 RepID=A0A369J5E2_HYPMA|nr:hypothetical protein Hypma_002869 [Hypsizygus marmoreus]
MEGISGTGASAFSPETVKEAAYARIKREIEASEAATRAWKGHHNSLSIISRLPPEILAHVFKFIADSSVALVRSGKLRWIVVSHVCRRWRSVALECPSLWTDIPISHPHWAKEMLVRSHMAPLTITAIVDEARQHHPYYTSTYHGDRHQAVIRSTIIDTLTHLPRIRVLSLTQSTTPDQLSEILQHLNKAAPMLNSLTISNTRLNLYIKLPKDAFPEGVPRLRHLELQRCSLSWDSAALLCDLTCLRLDNFPPEAQGSICEIVAVLLGLPNLISLELVSIIKPASSEAEIVAPACPAPLLHLTRLNMEADIFSCASLLSNLKYSKLTEVNIAWRYQILPENDFASTFPAIHELRDGLVKALKAPVRCLQVCGYSGTIQLWDSPGSCLSPPLGKPQISVTMLMRTVDSVRQAFIEFLSELPLQHLQTLHAIPLAVDTKDWVKFFGSIRSLRNINVSPHDPLRYPVEFVEALSVGIVPKGSSGRNPGKLRFKALQCLVMDDWYLDDLAGERLEAVAKMLAGCLLQRRKRGVALRKLYIQGCNHVDSNAVDMLSKVVRKVNWDGSEGFTDEEEDDEDIEPEDYYGYGYDDDDDDDDDDSMDDLYFGW